MLGIETKMQLMKELDRSLLDHAAALGQKETRQRSPKEGRPQHHADNTNL